MRAPLAPTNLRVGLYQGPAESADVATHVAAIRRAAEQAADADAQLLITPEMSATGYNIGELSARRAEPADGPLAEAIGTIAVDCSIAVVYGYPEIGPAGNYNTVAAVGPDGTILATHRKTHLYGELDRTLFVPGDTLVTRFELGGFSCGLAVCYEIEFPELARAHAEAGTDVLLVPTGLMSPFEVVSRILVPARAYENQLYVVYTNRCGTEDGLTYCGLSCAVSPDGDDLVRAGTGEELLVAELDTAALTAGRRVNTHLADRRADLYSLDHHDVSDRSRT